MRGYHHSSCNKFSFKKYELSTSDYISDNVCWTPTSFHQLFAEYHPSKQKIELEIIASDWGRKYFICVEYGSVTGVTRDKSNNVITNDFQIIDNELWIPTPTNRDLILNFKLYGKCQWACSYSDPNNYTIFTFACNNQSMNASSAIHFIPHLTASSKYTIPDCSSYCN